MRRTTILAVLAAGLAGSSAAGQEVLEHRIGRSTSGEPLVFTGFVAQDIGALAVAAQVPMGFESLPQGPRQHIVLTGLTLRAAIDAMLAADPRYEMTEDNGVVLFRPSGEKAAPLDMAAPAVHLDDITAREGVGLVAALLGTGPHTAISADDTRTFSIDVPAGTVLSVLNAIVRAHGTLTWVFASAGDGKPLFPYMLTMMAGTAGWGLGVPGTPPPQGVDLNRFRRSAANPATVLDAVVGNASDGFPLRVTGFGSLWRLSAAVKVPFGIEIADSTPYELRGSAVAFVATGRSLREVLNAMALQDPRYEWRELDGVIVVRTPRAWSDADDPLLAQVRDVQLYERPMREVAAAVFAVLGTPPQSILNFPDTRPLSLSVWRGTALDLLNALARTHGSLGWEYARADPEQVRAIGLAHTLTLFIAGGSGHGVPVR